MATWGRIGWHLLVVVAAAASALSLSRAAIGTMERLAWLLAIGGVAVSGYLQHRAAPRSSQAVGRGRAHAALAVALLFLIIGRSSPGDGVGIAAYAAGIVLSLVACVLFAGLLRARTA